MNCGIKSDPKNLVAPSNEPVNLESWFNGIQVQVYKKATKKGTNVEGFLILTNRLINQALLNSMPSKADKTKKMLISIHIKVKELGFLPNLSKRPAIRDRYI
ncbi:hypothetical protein [Desulfoscipio gibsoniae]